MRMRPVDTVWTPLRRRPLAVLAIVAVLIVSGIVLVGYRIMTDPDEPPCSPPSQQEQRGYEVFVHSHLEDAEDLEWHVADCDDKGEAELKFTTARTPAAARDAFLNDPACLPTTGPDATEYDVTCNSSAPEVSIWFEDTTGPTTTGMLWVP